MVKGRERNGEEGSVKKIFFCLPAVVRCLGLEKCWRFFCSFRFLLLKGGRWGGQEKNLERGWMGGGVLC